MMVGLTACMGLEALMPKLEQCRGFSLADAMILVAATALALACLRSPLEKPDDFQR
jgi:hypothetical protein